MTGSKKCAKQQRELEVLSVQLQQKVTFRRAIQIINGESETQNALKPEFAKRFDYQMSETDKALKKALIHYLGKKPKCIRSKGTDTFSIEITTREESEKLRQMTTIMNCKTKTAESRDRKIKALIYVKEYNMSDFEGYKKGLIAQFSFQDVIEAQWIKSKNDKAKPLLRTITGPNMPNFIQLPGEQDKTRLFEYKDRPMLCQKC